MALKVPQNQKKVRFIDKSFKSAMTMPQKKIRHKDGFYLWYFKIF
jgi:hypothetical protein